LDAFGKLKEEITTNSLGFHTALKKNIIYYFAPSGLICEDMATGKMIWNFPQKGMITNEPFYYKNTVYIGTGANLIYAINATTGEQKWSFTTDGTVIGDFVTDSSVILGHGGNYMYALDLETGLKKWELKFERKRPLAEPLIYHNSLYYGLSDSCIYEVRYKK
jgi:outer membrane protein assembly factor BamB